MNNDKLRSPIFSEARIVFRRLLVSKRQSLNLSQKRLADKLGVHHSMIGKIEIGDRRLEVLEFINYCQALEINPCEVLKQIKHER